MPRKPTPMDTTREYGYLTPLRFDRIVDVRGSYWWFKCRCGNIFSYCAAPIRAGQIRSCCRYRTTPNEKEIADKLKRIEIAIAATKCSDLKEVCTKFNMTKQGVLHILAKEGYQLVYEKVEPATPSREPNH